MSPNYYFYSSSRGDARVFALGNTGAIFNPVVTVSNGVRPVISLSKLVKLTGDGKYNNIYTVS